MSDIQIRSWFEFDEHRHLVMQADGTPMASVKFSHLSDGRDNAVNCMCMVKILFGADEPDDVKPVMEYQRINLTNKTSANGWKNIVEALSVGLGMISGWEPAVQEMISASLRNWYEGNASHAKLERADLDDVAPPFLITPLVSGSGMTLHYSPPGSNKSMVALGIAVSVSTGYPIFGAVPSTVGPVVYVDFEDVKEEHDKRLTAILNGIEWDGDDPDIIHYKVSGRFVDQLSQIRSVVRKSKAVLVIVDSLGKARNTDPSDGDATIKLTNAIESLGMPVLAIDHVTKADNRDIKDGKVKNPDAIMAIGSQFSTAGARLGWFFEQMGDSTATVKKYNIHNTKHNHVAKQETRSLKVEFVNNDRGIATNLSFTVWDTMQFEEMLAESAADMLVKWVARSTHRTVDATQLSKATGMPRPTVSGELNHSGYFEKTGKSQRPQFYRLSDDGITRARSLVGDQEAETLGTKEEKSE